MPHRFFRFLVPGLVCLGLLGAPGPARAVAPQITHHELEVRLDPDTHWLAATDRLHVVWDPTAGLPMNFLLSDALKVEAVRLDDGTALDWTVSAALRGRQQVTVLLAPSAPRQLRVTVSYRGAIADEVRPAGGLSFVAGDATTGIIDPQGIYLSGDSGWTPTGPDDLATYRIGVTVPEGWQVCTQGRLVRDGADRGGWRSEWVSTVPTDGLALVGGHYAVERRTVGDYTIATYLFPEHASAAATLIRAAAEDLAHFSELLGPYPFDEFAIVENFFSSGYGFPGFTLLGRGVLAQPQRLLTPGYLDHEIAHNWWGNGVFVDQREGNWAEALTTYYANYLAKEAEGAEVAAAHRRRNMLRYSVHAPPGADYPLAMFEAKTNKLDDAVGYTKGSMLVHQLRRAVGDEIFWPTMRDLAQAHIGTRAGWSTFIRALAQRSGQALEPWASEWLHRPGAPELRLDEVRVTPEAGGYTLAGVLVQEGEPYTLSLPVVLDTSRGPVRTVLHSREARTRFSLAVPGVPIAMQVDPDEHVFRRLALEDQVPCLNRTLFGGAPLCVYPEDPRDPRNAVYRTLAEQAAQERKGQAVPLSEVTSRLLADRSLLVFGNVEGHPLLRPLLDRAAALPRIDTATFTLNGTRHAGTTEAVLASAVHPAAPARTVTLYAGNTPGALDRARLLFFYGWDSVIRFEAGRPVERFDLPNAARGLSWDGLAALGPPPDPDRIHEVVRYLADPWLLGRLTGQPDTTQARQFLVNRFRELGLHKGRSFTQEFTFSTPRVLTQDPQAVLGYRRTDYPARVWPVWWSAPQSAQGQVMFAGYGWADASWDDYRRQRADGRLVVVLGGGPPGQGPLGPLEALERQVLAAQERDASGVLVAVPAAELSAYLPALALPFTGLPWPEPESPRGTGQTARPALELRATRERSRAPAPAAAVRIPVWILPWDPVASPRVGPLDLARWRGRLQTGRVTTVRRIRGARANVPAVWATAERTGTNVIGRLEGTDPLLKDEAVVVGAHYDHLGLADTGQVFRGADDNASGVAALLAAAELLAGRRADLRRSVIFVAFDAEEWGLLGSEAFLAANAAAPKRIVAMLNADSVGRNIEDRVYLVGASRHPGLGDPARAWATRLGLAVGRDIDAFAYAHGSDHWPFAERGIPALTLFASDYQALDSLRDVPEATDEGHIARVAHLLAALTYEVATRPPATATVAGAAAPAPAAPPVAPLRAPAP